MSSLVDRVLRLRWLAVPLAAYLMVTLALPAAHGATARADFGRHATWVLTGCVAVVAVALVGGALIELVRGGVRRMR